MGLPDDRSPLVTAECWQSVGTKRIPQRTMAFFETHHFQVMGVVRFQPFSSSPIASFRTSLPYPQTHHTHHTPFVIVP